MAAILREGWHEEIEDAVGQHFELLKRWRDNEDREDVRVAESVAWGLVERLINEFDDWVAERWCIRRRRRANCEALSKE